MNRPGPGPKMTRDTMLAVTKTYDNWLRDQELVAARATAPADRTDWQRQIVERDSRPTYWDHDGPRTMPEITDFLSCSGKGV